MAAQERRQARNARGRRGERWMHGTRRERDAVAREARVWLPARADEVEEGCEVNLGGGRGRRSRRTRRSSELWLADIIGYQEWGWQADGATVGTGLRENRKVVYIFFFRFALLSSKYKKSRYICLIFSRFTIFSRLHCQRFSSFMV